MARAHTAQNGLQRLLGTTTLIRRAVRMSGRCRANRRQIGEYVQFGVALAGTLAAWPHADACYATALLCDSATRMRTS